MKQGSPEWLRAKYAAMLIAHLSMTEPLDDALKGGETSSADEKPSNEERSDDHAS